MTPLPLSSSFRQHLPTPTHPPSDDIICERSHTHCMNIEESMADLSQQISRRKKRLLGQPVVVQQVWTQHTLGKSQGNESICCRGILIYDITYEQKILCTDIANVCNKDQKIVSSFNYGDIKSCSFNVIFFSIFQLNQRKSYQGFNPDSCSRCHCHRFLTGPRQS